MSEQFKSEMVSLTAEAIYLLQRLIAIPSFSKDESGTADFIARFLDDKSIPYKRKGNNIWALNRYFDPEKPVILLNSHHDTVKPNQAWTKDPFDPILDKGKLYGLGSNDAGGCLVSLLAAFLYFYERKDLPYSIIFAATSEEEISGANGIESILYQLGPVSFAIVGEPTMMQMAIAEKGLMVLDAKVYGIAGHAAREEGENAIYKAIKDIDWFQTFHFEKESPLLGPVKMNVTIFHAGTQHNMVPAICEYTVDIRLNECYTHDEVLEIIQENVRAEIKPRSTRIKPSSIDFNHPIVQSGLQLGLKTFGSATTSDQALMPFPSVKIGPGDSARSHTADEFIYLSDISNGIETYILLLEDVFKTPKNQKN